MFIFELTSLNYCKARWFNLFYDQKLIDVSLPRNSKMERWNIKKHYFIKHSTILHFYIDILSCFKRNAFNLKCTSFRQSLLIMCKIQFYQQVHFRRANALFGFKWLLIGFYWNDWTNLLQMKYSDSFIAQWRAKTFVTHEIFPTKVPCHHF